MGRYEPFAAIYDRWSADMTEDVPFSVAREADGPVVELAVGSGRVAIPFKRQASDDDSREYAWVARKPS